MAKLVLTPQPGALKKILAAEHKTFEDVSGALQMSRVTLRAINDGKPIKDGTLQRLADFLRRPITHFLSDEKQPTANSEGDKKILIEYSNDWGTSAHVLLKRMNGADFENVMKWRTKIQWQLRVLYLSERAAELLRKIEALVKESQDSEERIFVKDVGTGGLQGANLSALIDRVEGAVTFEEHLKSLAEEGIYVLGVNYLHWERQSDEHDYYRDGTTVGVDDYVCQSRQLIAVLDSSVSTMRQRISIGVIPPKNASESLSVILVNGRELDGEFDPDLRFQD
jgi:hypothetical protein